MTADTVASCLYHGRVMHHRLRPVRHRFVYRVFSLYLDLDELPDVGRSLRLSPGLRFFETPICR